MSAEMESNGIMKDFCTDILKIRIDRSHIKGVHTTLDLFQEEVGVTVS